MKAYQKTLIALAATSALAMSANAAVSYGGSSAGQPYIGVKVGQFDLDTNLANAKNPTAYGVYGGYNFDQNFGAEVEYVGSDDARFDAVDSKLSAKSYGAYGTYRYHFNNTPVYAKGKLGIARTEAKATAVNLNTKASSTSLAGGVGLGFKATENFNIEAGYNYLDSDANMWAVGAHINF
ncbi:MAG: porin family protein [Moraxella sp.]|nr:porin family protein [Moraxella sp.]